MFVELLNGSLLNMFNLQNIFIDTEDSSILCYLLVNGSILKESCGSSSNAQERYKTVKALLTGHLEELKAQVTQLEVTVSDAIDDVDTINGVIV